MHAPPLLANRQTPVPALGTMQPSMNYMRKNDRPQSQQSQKVQSLIADLKSSSQVQIGGSSSSSSKFVRSPARAAHHGGSSQYQGHATSQGAYQSQGQSQTQQVYQPHGMNFSTQGVNSSGVTYPSSQGAMHQNVSYQNRFENDITTPGVTTSKYTPSKYNTGGGISTGNPIGANHLYYPPERSSKTPTHSGVNPSNQYSNGATSSNYNGMTPNHLNGTTGVTPNLQIESTPTQINTPNLQNQYGINRSFSHYANPGSLPGDVYAGVVQVRPDEKVQDKILEKAKSLQGMANSMIKEQITNRDYLANSSKNLDPMNDQVVNLPSPLGIRNSPGYIDESVYHSGAEGTNMVYQQDRFRSNIEDRKALIQNVKEQLKLLGSLDSNSRNFGSTGAVTGTDNQGATLGMRGGASGAADDIDRNRADRNRAKSANMDYKNTLNLQRTAADFGHASPSIYSVHSTGRSPKQMHMTSVVVDRDAEENMIGRNQFARRENHTTSDLAWSNQDRIRQSTVDRINPQTTRTKGGKIMERGMPNIKNLIQRREKNGRPVSTEVSVINGVRRRLSRVGIATDVLLSDETPDLSPQNQVRDGKKAKSRGTTENELVSPSSSASPFSRSPFTKQGQFTNDRRDKAKILEELSARLDGSSDDDGESPGCTTGEGKTRWSTSGGPPAGSGDGPPTTGGDSDTSFSPDRKVRLLMGNNRKLDELNLEYQKQLLSAQNNMIASQSREQELEDMLREKDRQLQILKEKQNVLDLENRKRELIGQIQEIDDARTPLDNTSPAPSSISLRGDSPGDKTSPSKANKTENKQQTGNNSSSTDVGDHLNTSASSSENRSGDNRSQARGVPGAMSRGDRYILEHYNDDVIIPKMFDCCDDEENLGSGRTGKPVNPKGAHSSEEEVVEFQNDFNAFKTGDFKTDNFGTPDLKGLGKLGTPDLNDVARNDLDNLGQDSIPLLSNVPDLDLGLRDLGSRDREKEDISLVLASNERKEREFLRTIGDLNAENRDLRMENENLKIENQNLKLAGGDKQELGETKLELRNMKQELEATKQQLRDATEESRTTKELLKNAQKDLENLKTIERQSQRESQTGGDVGKLDNERLKAELVLAQEKSDKLKRALDDAEFKVESGVKKKEAEFAQRELEFHEREEVIERKELDLDLKSQDLDRNLREYERNTKEYDRNIKEYERKQKDFLEKQKDFLEKEKDFLEKENDILEKEEELNAKEQKLMAKEKEFMEEHVATSVAGKAVGKEHSLDHPLVEVQHEHSNRRSIHAKIDSGLHGNHFTQVHDLHHREQIIHHKEKAIETKEKEIEHSERAVKERETRLANLVSSDKQLQTLLEQMIKIFQIRQEKAALATKDNYQEHRDVALTIEEILDTMTHQFANQNADPSTVTTNMKLLTYYATQLVAKEVQFLNERREALANEMLMWKAKAKNAGHALAKGGPVKGDGKDGLTSSLGKAGLVKVGAPTSGDGKGDGNAAKGPDAARAARLAEAKLPGSTSLAADGTKVEGTQLTMPIGGTTGDGVVVQCDSVPAQRQKGKKKGLVKIGAIVPKARGSAAESEDDGSMNPGYTRGGSMNVQDSDDHDVQQRPVLQRIQEEWGEMQDLQTEIQKRFNDQMQEAMRLLSGGPLGAASSAASSRSATNQRSAMREGDHFHAAGGSISSSSSSDPSAFSKPSAKSKPSASKISTDPQSGSEINDAKDGMGYAASDFCMDLGTVRGNSASAASTASSAAESSTQSGGYDMRNLKTRGADMNLVSSEGISVGGISTSNSASIEDLTSIPREGRHDVAVPHDCNEGFSLGTDRSMRLQTNRSKMSQASTKHMRNGRYSLDDDDNDPHEDLLLETHPETNPFSVSKTMAFSARQQESCQDESDQIGCNVDQIGCNVDQNVFSFDKNDDSEGHTMAYSGTGRNPKGYILGEPEGPVTVSPTGVSDVIGRSIGGSIYNAEHIISANERDSSLSQNEQMFSGHATKESVSDNSNEKSKDPCVPGTGLSNGSMSSSQSDAVKEILMNLSELVSDTLSGTAKHFERIESHVKSSMKSDVGTKLAVGNDVGTQITKENLYLEDYYLEALERIEELERQIERSGESKSNLDSKLDTNLDINLASKLDNNLDSNPDSKLENKLDIYRDISETSVFGEERQLKTQHTLQGETLIKQEKAKSEEALLRLSENYAGQLSTLQEKNVKLLEEITRLEKGTERLEIEVREERREKHDVERKLSKVNIQLKRHVADRSRIVERESDLFNRQMELIRQERETVKKSLKLNEVLSTSKGRERNSTQVQGMPCGSTAARGDKNSLVSIAFGRQVSPISIGGQLDRQIPSVRMTGKLKGELHSTNFEAPQKEPGEEVPPRRRNSSGILESPPKTRSNNSMNLVPQCSEAQDKSHSLKDPPHTLKDPPSSSLEDDLQPELRLRMPNYEIREYPAPSGTQMQDNPEDGHSPGIPEDLHDGHHSLVTPEDVREPCSPEPENRPLDVIGDFSIGNVSLTLSEDSEDGL